MARMEVIIMYTLFCRETLKETIWKSYVRINSTVSKHKIEERFVKIMVLGALLFYDMQDIFWLARQLCFPQRDCSMS